MHRANPPNWRNAKLSPADLRIGLASLAVAARLAAPPAHAQADATQAPDGAPAYAVNLLGGIGGLRPALAQRGLTFNLTDTTEVMGNPSGGLRQEGVFEGLGFASLAFDGGKAMGWGGFSAWVSAWGIYGRGLSANAVGNLNTVSNVEADRSLRLFELWVEQAMAGGRVALRIGQQSVDQEFLVDGYAAPFVNAHYGFPDLPSNDLPSGGPIYPIATPAIRLKLRASDSVTLLLALFNGDPAPPGPGNDPQARDNSGTTFRTNGGALWFAEAQWSRNQGADATGLPGSFKLGGWYHTSPFADQRLAADGLSLANPASNGRPLQRHGDWSLYALADQLLWRGPGGGADGIAAFVRGMGAPGDRNLVDFSVDGGLTWQGALRGRDSDIVGLGFEWARIGDQASKLDGDTALFSGVATPVRRWEAAFELTYQAQLRPWWQVQPDLQYVVRPGGGLPAPSDPTRRAADAVVLGLRTGITF